MSLKQFELHTLHWDNVNPKIVESHKKVMGFFDLDVKYTQVNMLHGAFMNHVMQNTTADYVGFIDIDAVPTGMGNLFNRIETAVCENNYLFGPAQCTNCIQNRYHIFAAPSFFFISREMYEQISRPSFLNNGQIADCAQQVTQRYEEHLLPYKLLFPVCFEDIPPEGLWRLGGYGYYGIGTVYGANELYHLFGSRLEGNPERFQTRCNQIMRGTFSNALMGMYDSLTEYRGEFPIAEE